MKLTKLIIPVLNTLLWGAIAYYIGVDGLRGIRERGAEANQYQIAYYLILPLIMFGLGLLCVLLMRTRRVNIASAWSTASLLLVLPWGCYSGAGI